MSAAPNYSVLMSVYAKEKPDYLRTSMESIRKQTVPPDEFVLVCDGPLGRELEQVILEMQASFGETLRVIRLEKNGGLGNALNIGIQTCKNELVARMDSDDISYPDRCERQLKIFEAYPKISIVSGTVEEFAEDPGSVTARRVVPKTQREILSFVKKRNPFNHPCVMYKKSAVQMAGGYQDFYLLEDYYLWIRMLQQGFEGYNIQEPLLKMRAGSAMYLRRSGIKYARSQAKLFHYMEKQGMIGRFPCMGFILARAAMALLPNSFRKGLFGRLLRKN